MVEVPGVRVVAAVLKVVRDTFAKNKAGKVPHLSRHRLS